MSFTMVRYKDGKPVRVKMSIWDAFKGVPNPKPAKPKPCGCCNKIHKKGGHDTITATGKKDGGTVASKTDDKQDKSGSVTGEKKSSPSNDKETYSEEDDRTIIEMKSESKSYKEILQAIGKTSEWQLKAHWKTIDPAKKDQENNNKDSASSDGKKTNSENNVGKAHIKDGKSKKNKKQNDAEIETADTEKPTATPNVLQDFAARYDNRKWMAAASKHFDLTGERITPLAARKLAEGK